MARNSENEPTHPPKTNESTTADFTTLPSYIGHQWEHHPDWLGKNQHLFQVTKRLKPGPRAGKLHLPEGVPEYGQPRSLFPTGPRCPVSNPKGSHLVMKKNDSENVCAWGVWSAETLNIPRNSGGSIPNIWVQWDHHALFRWETSTQMSKHQASKCPPGLVPLPSLWTGPSHNSRCQKEQLQHAGERSEEFFVTSPEKKHTHKIKDPSSGWSWKKSSNMFSSNLYYQWPWKVMHLSMWQWSPWRKTGKRPYGPSVWDLGEPFSSRDRLCELHSMTWRFGQWVCNG